MSSSIGETSIPHRYRKGRGGGKRKSALYKAARQTKKPQIIDGFDSYWFEESEEENRQPIQTGALAAIEKGE